MSETDSVVVELTPRCTTLIDLIPEDVLIAIFSCLSLKDISSITRVCKKWHNVESSEKFWKQKSEEFDVDPTHKCEIDLSLIKHSEVYSKVELMWSFEKLGYPIIYKPLPEGKELALKSVAAKRGVSYLGPDSVDFLLEARKISKHFYYTPLISTPLMILLFLVLLQLHLYSKITNYWLLFMPWTILTIFFLFNILLSTFLRYKRPLQSTFIGGFQALLSRLPGATPYITFLIQAIGLFVFFILTPYNLEQETETGWRLSWFAVLLPYIFGFLGFTGLFIYLGWVIWTNSRDRVSYFQSYIFIILLFIVFPLLVAAKIEESVSASWWTIFIPLWIPSVGLVFGVLMALTLRLVAYCKTKDSSGIAALLCAVGFIISVMFIELFTCAYLENGVEQIQHPLWWFMCLPAEAMTLITSIWIYRVIYHSNPDFTLTFMKHLVLHWVK